MDANLLGTIAGRLVYGKPHSDPAYNRRAMATFVSPDLAVTSVLVIDIDAEDWSSGSPPEILLDFPLRPDLGRFRVFLEGYDHELDFAVFKLEKPISIPTQPSLSTESDVTGKQWESLFFGPEVEQVFGSVADFYFSGYERLVLEVSSPQSPRNAIGGAPILVDGKVIAITSEQIPPQAFASKKPIWLAVPIWAMAGSKSTDAIRRILEEQESSKPAVASLSASSPGNEETERASIESVLQKLKDANSNLRADAIMALGDELTRNPRVKDTLMFALDDQDQMVRRAAILTLGDLANEDFDVRMALVARLRDQSNIVRRAAVKALRLATADPLVEEAIKGRLNDVDNEVQTLAAAVLTAAREARAEAQAPASASDDRHVEKVESAAPAPEAAPEEVVSQTAPQSLGLDREALFARLSPSSLRALSHAKGMRQHLAERQITTFSKRPELSAIETGRLKEMLQLVPLGYLVAGLFENEDGPTRKLFLRRKIGAVQLAEFFEEEQDIPWLSRSDYSPVKLDKLPDLSANTERALQAARDIADENGSAQIQSRHLLYGALSIQDHPLVKLLAEAGVRRELVPLDEARPAPAPVPTSIAFVSADTSDGKDLLGFEPDVDALSKIIAAKDIDPPLSIGLFGDWGSGKSFFMRQMENRIRELTDIGRAAKGKSSYCENVVHIWFNAWSYMDTDLWASLVTEIFEELAQAIDSDQALAGGMDPTTAKARLLAATASARDVLADEEKKRDAAQTELEASEKRLGSLKATDEELEARLSTATILKDAYRVLADDKSIEADLEAAAKRLNIPKAQRAGKDLKVRLLELSNTWSALRLALKGWKRPRTWLLPLLVLAAALVLLWVVVPKALDVHLDSAIGQAAKVVASIIAALSPFLAKAERAVSIIQRVKESQRDRIEELRQQIEQEPRKQQQQVKEKLNLAEERVKNAREELIKLEQLQEEMRADKKLSDFIRQRSLSTDYTSRMGTVARARRDFKHLSDLIDSDREARKKNENGAQDQTQPASPLLPRIDRIVLYIDDLDRCAEDKVVQVLEAVHLLLAFRLFVVIVAVDSRWLLRSLRKHSMAFQNSADGEAGISGEELSHWESTPLNYLEKIFQIPFYLTPMRKGGFGQLVDAVVGNIASDQLDQTDEEKKEEEKSDAISHEDQFSSRSSVDEAIETKGTAPQPGDLDKGTKTPEAEPAGDSVKSEAAESTGASQTPPLDKRSVPIPKDEPVSEESRQALPTYEEANPAALQLRKWERDFMKKLHPLIISPRSAKRFINIYRLLRVSITDQNELTRFVGNKDEGNYRTASLLLAILTGYPVEATDILRDLLEKDRPETWWQYIDDLEANWNSTSNKLSTGSAELSAQRRRDLMVKLKLLRGEIPAAQSCDQFVKWASRVARYSFESGRVLMLLNDETDAD